MALGKSSRTDNRRSSSSYCSTIAIFVFVALCLVGVWVMTSQSVVPFPTVSEASLENSGEEKEQVSTPTNEGSSQHFKDSQGFLPDDAIKGGSNEGETQEEKIEEKTDDKFDEDPKSDEELNNRKQDETSKGDSGTEETKTEDGDGNSEEQESDGQKPDRNYHSDDNEKNPGEVEDNNELKSDGNPTDEQEQEKNNQQEPSGEDIDNSQMKNETLSDILPFGAQSELLNETMAANVSFPTQATESKNEKDAQLSSDIKKEYSWKLCNTTAGPDFIPCLDNWLAVRSLRSTKHYEHRERHCPQEPPTCLVPLPDGYKRPIQWPISREKIWYDNVPHTKLAEYKGHQNWVKVSGEYLTFPGGGTQFKHGASHYIEFIQRSVPDIAWGRRTRVILDVGCGVASFGGFLFDKDVLTMSLAPKDEHEAQVQFALERGIPAISAVMGTQRLPFPGRVFDAVHCARCRVPWHIEGGKLLLELNRVLRPGGFFVWSATPVYQKLSEDVGIWKAMSKLTKDMCWELVSINKDTVNGVGVATFRKPASNDCYKSRSQQEPPLCSPSDDPNAAWHVPLQACMHKVPEDKTERGSQWPEQWPARMEKPPYWLSSSQVGVYGKTAPEDFAADYEHWKRVVTKSYLKGLGINWSSVRNVMDMRAVYGGFAAALRDLNMWVMNVVPIDSADTLPIIYERGLFGIYHDWCESFSTYPRSYDLLHADHLFSKIKSRCNFVAVIAEVDRMLRPEGKLIIRDNVEMINKLETVVRSMNWEIRMTYYSKDNEGLLCVQKTFWRPRESEQLPYATI